MVDLRWRVPARRVRRRGRRFFVLFDFLIFWVLYLFLLRLSTIDIGWALHPTGFLA